MPKVPFTDNVVPMQAGDGPSPTDFAMAAAMMHQEGRLFEPAAYMNSLSRYGRPNIKADAPTKDKLKNEEERMEIDQDVWDGKTENEPIKFKRSKDSI